MMILNFIYNAIFSRSRLTRQGFSIIQAMMVLAVMSILTVGVSTMFIQYLRVSADNTLRTTLLRLRKEFYSNIMHPVAWRNTVADVLLNPSMGCLRSGANCGHNTSGDLTLKSADNSVFFDYTAGTNTTNGFTLDGIPCNTFSTNPGSDSCPISFTVRWITDCPANTASQCTNPPLRLQVTPIIRPSGSTAARQSTARFSAINITKAINVNTNDIETPYTINTIRSGASSISTFKASEVVFGGGPTGICTPGSNWGTAGTRNINREEDPEDLIYLAGGNVFLRHPGTYRCFITIPAYGVNRFRARLYNETAGRRVPGDSIAAHAFQGGGTTARSQKFTFLAPLIHLSQANTELEIRMLCETSNFGGLQQDYGIPIVTGRDGFGSPTYTETTLTTMYCDKIN